MTPNTSKPKPCAAYEAACMEAAWGLERDPAWATHLDSCPRCQEAFSAARAFVERVSAGPEPIPEGLLEGLAPDVFAATTRHPARSFSIPWAWVGAATGLAAAGAAFLTLRRPSDRLPAEARYLTEVDLELLEELELAENLEILEVLDALEEMDDV